MMMQGNGQVSVPPGFRFHPTDEELLYYYLRKKVSYEAIDLDVIREVDLNKLEPWDLKDKCRIGSSCEDEWYFFSHKDKKYPTGSRTNRATGAGFWKATGRDKGIYMSSNSRRIGMRKTLVFYIGRAPRGKKTDWIMHEYRLEDTSNAQFQDDGWVVCRVFKKKNHYKTYHTEVSDEDEYFNVKKPRDSTPQHEPQHKLKPPCHGSFTFDSSMHLPQLLSPESVCTPTFFSPAPLNSMDMTLNGYGVHRPEERLHGGGEWSFLDKLLASNHHHRFSASSSSSQQIIDVGTASISPKLPFQLGGCEAHIMDFPQ